MQLITGISRKALSKVYKCHHLLSVSGNSEIIHFRILINMHLSIGFIATQHERQILIK